MHSPPVTSPPRGGRPLHLAFHLPFMGAAAGLIGLALWALDAAPADVAGPFAPRLALGFLAVLAVVVALYAVTLRALGSRVREAQAREQRERETLRIIGHHVRSPLQALLALNPPATCSWPYIDRIDRAVQAVFGGDGRRDACSRPYGEPVRIDLADFLAQLTANSARAGVPDVVFSATFTPVPVDVDDGALSDVLAQVLDNAHRSRLPGTSIRVSLSVHAGKALITIENRGPAIRAGELEQIFGFEASLVPATPGGRGLYVAREMVTRMNGTIAARNLAGGVAMEILIPVARRT